MKFSEHSIEVKTLDEISTRDWHNVMLLRSEIFVTTQQCVYTDPDFDDEQATHLLIKNEDAIQVYCRLLKKDDWHIGRIVTRQQYRGQGLAKEIITRAIITAQSIDCSKPIVMSAQVYLSPYYEKLEFHPTGRMYLEDGIPHIKMVYQPS